MSAVDWAGILVMAGVGGVLGAASMVLLAGARASGAFNSFKQTFREYIGGRSDPASEALEMEFSTLDSSLSSLLQAVDKLKKALRLK